MRRQRSLIGPQGMGGLVSLWGASSLIKSIQRGTITWSNPNSGTATISAVDMNNAYVTFVGSDVNTDTTATGSNSQSVVQLTNSTTVTASSWGTVNTKVLSWEVMEFVPGVIKSIQRIDFLYVPDASYTATQTITAVNVNKTQLIYGGNSTNDGNTQEYSGRSRIRASLTNSTTVTVSKGVNINYAYFYGTAVEFF